MKLSADIIAETLSNSLKITVLGTRSPELTLGRPELYEGGNEPLLSNHLYLCYADRLPQRIHIEQGCTIVCIGDSKLPSRHLDKACIIAVGADTDFFKTFNILQHTYDKFDAWDLRLRNAAIQGDLQEMVNTSLEIFKNPIFCMDSNFNIMASAQSAGSIATGPIKLPVGGTSLGIEAMNSFLENHELSMSSREPMIINLLDQTTLNYNLYYDDTYEGCLTIHCTDNDYRPSDKQLAKFLGDQIIQAMRHFSLLSQESQSSIAKVAQDIIEDKPLDATGRSILFNHDNSGFMLCARIKPFGKSKQLPLGYISSLVEDSFDHCIAFEFRRNSVVALLFSDDDKADIFLQNALETFEGISTTLGLKVGISEPFYFLVESQIRFLQANYALDNGILRKSDEFVYTFEEFALAKMVENATSDMSIEALAPLGFLRLIEHDESSDMSYIETLRSFLDNNMNVTRTANELYIHRSTLIERITRIRREIGPDFDSPEMQLRLRILLKALLLREESQA